MERVMFVVAGNDQTRLIELVTSNQIDITALQGSSIRLAIERNEKVTAHNGRKAPYGYVDWWTQALWLNNEKPPYDNVDVRWGISYLNRPSADRGHRLRGPESSEPDAVSAVSGTRTVHESISDLLEQYDTNEFNPEKAAAHFEACRLQHERRRHVGGR